MPFFFKHSNSKLKMSVTWKCFDGIQREEVSISDVRNQFRFQICKELFHSDNLIVKCLCVILEEKRISSMQSLLLNCFWRDQQHIFVSCRFQTTRNNRRKCLLFVLNILKAFF